MNIEKLPSGSYRVRQMIEGRTYSITLPYKPSKKEAYTLLEDKRTGRDKLRLTFDQAAVEYINGKRNTISPATVRGYESLRKIMPDSIKNALIGDITAWDVQKYINELSADHSPKTVRNHHGFISAVLSTFNPSLILHTNLPQKTVRALYIPSDSDIRRIIEDVAGSEYEIPFRLACYGLRRSEICALTLSDLSRDVLTINKAMVKDENNQWVIKTTKTASSTRQIIIDKPLAAKIRSSKAIYDGDPNNLWKKLQSVQKRLEIAPFPFHMLRHYYATTAHAQGMPDAVIMASGGWKTDHVMKNIYRHEKKEQVTKLQRQYAKNFVANSVANNGKKN